MQKGFEWTDAELQAAELVLPSEEPKVPVSIRLDSEVVDYFKRAGRGTRAASTPSCSDTSAASSRSVVTAEPATMP